VTTTDITPAGGELEALEQLRNIPVQGRSLKRLAALEDAAREALRIHGRDRLTTKHVADIAGASIGTVYRYFPDRVAILDRIWPERDRGAQKVLTEAAAVAEQLSEPRVAGWLMQYASNLD
jgi:AcrR family transcriptional regulator